MNNLQYHLYKKKILESIYELKIRKSAIDQCMYHVLSKLKCVWDSNAKALTTNLPFILNECCINVEWMVDDVIVVMRH